MTLPFQMVLSLRFVRRHVAFSGRELSAALWKSAVGHDKQRGRAALGRGALRLGAWIFPSGQLRPALFLAAIGWTVGLLVTRHPALLELRRVVEHLAETAFVRRLRERAGAHASRAGSRLAASGVASRR